MNIYEVLRRPLITEKAMALRSQGKYVFEVAPKARKMQVKLAVETAFNVAVVNVHVINLPGKLKRMGKRVITTPSQKKAVVTLAAGNKIEFFEGV